MTKGHAVKKVDVSRNVWPFRMRGLGLWIVPLLLLQACAGPEAAHELADQAASIFPEQEWDRWNSPEEGGFSANGLRAVEDRLQEMSSSAMMVVSRGRVAYEYGDLTEVSYLASVRKSILAVLYGIYRERGLIDLDLTLEDMGVDDVEGLLPSERQATGRHLIQARSGIYHPASNSGDNLADAPPRGSQTAGSYYLYSNWDFNAAGTVFEVQTGIDIFDALERDLAIPLGFRDFERSRHEKGGDLTRSMHPSYHMHLSTRDMARIGYLILRNGQWNGAEIVSPGWVEEMTSPITRVSEMNPEFRKAGPHGYGYMWWVWDGEHAQGPFEGAYTGVGAVGQYITVLPALDVVVAHKTVPGQGRRVEHPQFWELLDVLVGAYCGATCLQGN